MNNWPRERESDRETDRQREKERKRKRETERKREREKGVEEMEKKKEEERHGRQCKIIVMSGTGEDPFLYCSCVASKTSSIQRHGLCRMHVARAKPEGTGGVLPPPSSRALRRSRTFAPMQKDDGEMHNVDFLSAEDEEEGDMVVSGCCVLGRVGVRETTSKRSTTRWIQPNGVAN